MRRQVLVVMVASTAVFAAACSSDSTQSASAATESVPTESAASEPTESAGGVNSDPLPSPGCGAGAGSALSAERQSFDIGGSARWYLLTAPEAATATDPVPLVLDFHGLSEGAEFHSAATGYTEVAQSEGFVVAFPHGTGQPVAWNISSGDDNPDLAYVDEMLRQIEDSYCIDTARVYATGLSNGALMSSMLACARADVFAAVAPVAGVARAQDCDPGRPVPVITFHGTEDPLLPFNGTVSGDAISSITSGDGATTTTAPPGDIDGEGYPASAAAWAEANGCGDPADEQVSESVLRRSWQCPKDGEVVFYVIEGGGHTWPGSDALTNEGIQAIVGPTTMEIDATALAWDFLKSHSLPA